jgi:hypothetical protein
MLLAADDRIAVFQGPEPTGAADSEGRAAHPLVIGTRPGLV